MQTARIIRLGGMLGGGIVATLLLAAFIVPRLLNWNEYRGDLELAASSLLKKPMKIDGDLEVRLLPFPTVSAGGVRIIGENDAQSIVTVGSLDVSLSIMALLSGNVNVTRLTLDGVDLSLVQSSTGDWSVAGFSAGEGKTESNSFQLDDVRIENSTIRLTQNDGTETEVSGLFLNLSGTAPAGPLSWSGRASVFEVPLSLSGRVKPLSNERDTSIKLIADFAGAKAELNGILAGSGAFDGRLKLEAGNAALFEQALYRLTRQGKSPKLPTENLDVDARISFGGAQGTIETKRLTLGSATARAEITLLGKSWQNFSGRLAIGPVDLDSWQFLPSEESPSADGEITSNTSSLFGDIEVSIDAVRWHGESVRQIDVAMALDGETLNLSKAQALLPGGGTLSLGGVYHFAGDSPSYEGRIGLKTGRLKDLLAWFGAEESQIPKDRLMSLDWRSAMTYHDSHIELADITARLDDSSITGAVAFADDFSLSSLDVAVDRVNLDAYMPAPANEKPAASEDKPVALPKSVKLSVGDLIVNQIRLSRVELTSEQDARGRAAVSARARAFDGSVSLTGTVNALSATGALDLDMAGTGINKAAMLAHVGGLNEVSRALGGETLDFTLSVDGTLDNLTADGSFSSGSDELSARGSLAFFDNSLSEVNMQAKLALADSNAVMRAFGIEGAHGASNLDVTIDGDMAEAVALRVAGTVAGSALITKGIWTAEADTSGAFKGDMNLAIGEVHQLPASLQYMPGLAGLRLKSDLEYSAEEMALNKIDMAIAGGRITGGIKLSGEGYKVIAGQLSADGLQFVDAPTKNATLSEPWSKQEFHPLPTAGMTGALDIAINSLGWKGQDVSNAKASLNFNSKGFDLSFSELAVNSAPAKFSALIADDSEGRQIDMNADIAVIRTAPLLHSLTGSVVSEGTASLALRSSGHGRSVHDLVASLKGQGEFHATAGTFKFMDLVKLAGALRNPASGVSAISSIGGMLGKGNTSFSQLDGVMVMDKGIITVTSMKGAGDWGALNLSGPLDLVRETMDLSGVIKLSQPQDVPEIGVSFTGPITHPRKKFKTDTLLRYALSKVQLLRRDEAQRNGEVSTAPAEVLVGKALDFLGKLKKKKKKDQEKDNQER